MFFKVTSMKKPGKLTNYNSAEEIFMTQSILLKWNEIYFPLKVIRLLIISLSLPFHLFIDKEVYKVQVNDNKMPKPEAYMA